MFLVSGCPAVWVRSAWARSGALCRVSWRAPSVRLSLRLPSVCRGCVSASAVAVGVVRGSAWLSVRPRIALPRARACVLIWFCLLRLPSGVGCCLRLRSARPALPSAVRRGVPSVRRGRLAARPSGCPWWLSVRGASPALLSVRRCDLGALSGALLRSASAVGRLSRSVSVCRPARRPPSPSVCVSVRLSPARALSPSVCRGGSAVRLALRLARVRVCSAVRPRACVRYGVFVFPRARVRIGVFFLRVFRRGRTAVRLRLSGALRPAWGRRGARQGGVAWGGRSALGFASFRLGAPNFSGSNLFVYSEL